MKRYVLVYRTSGIDNFKWNRSLPFLKHSEAMEARDVNMRMGYHTFIEDYEQSMTLGLLEGYKYTLPC